MKVLQVCAYAAPYEGNFMKSIYKLHNYVRAHGNEIIYAFPETAKTREWCQQLAEREVVYFLPLKKARINPHTYTSLLEIFMKHSDIAVVHSHFELYDIPLAVTTPKGIKLFWHLHDALSKQSFSREVLKVLQYRYLSKRATLISVAEKYRLELIELGFPEKQTCTILNGIDLDRISDSTSYENKPYDFLAFVWDYNRKGCDLILKACAALLDSGYKFKILLIGTNETKREISLLFPNGTEAITVDDAKEDINALYRAGRVFVSASRKETFSYAVCESAYAGLSVICSRIPGLEWASALPTATFFENEDVRGLFSCMKQYLKGMRPISADIESTRLHIRNSYSAEHWAEQIYQAYGMEHA